MLVGVLTAGRAHGAAPPAVQVGYSHEPEGPRERKPPHPSVESGIDQAVEAGH